MTELLDALKVNEAAMGGERVEYKTMLRNSFDAMIERLSVLFVEEKVIKFGIFRNAKRQNIINSKVKFQCFFKFTLEQFSKLGENDSVTQMDSS